MGHRGQLSWLMALAVSGAVALGLVVAHGQSEELRLVRFLSGNVDEKEIVVLALSDTSKMQRLAHTRVLYTETVHWDDVVGYAGAWVVASPDAEIPMIGHVSVRDLGPYRVHHLDMKRTSWAGTGWDLVSHLPLASVQRVDDVLHPCPLREGVFACPGEPWFSVELRRVTMAGKPVHCIYAHPADASRLIVVFPTTDGGSGILLEGGIDDDGVYDPAGTQVIVSVQSGGKTLGDLFFANTPGVQSCRLAFDTRLRPPAPLVLEITSASQNTRHFCFWGQLEP